MTNRDKYITKRNEYDLMLSILKSDICPIYAVAGLKEKLVTCWDVAVRKPEVTCEECIQKWLNKKSA